MITKIIIGILSFSLCGVIGAYCDDTEIDKTPVVKSVKGYVSAVDWVSQRLIVRTYNYGEKDDVTIFVPDGCPITKGTNNIFFGDIIQSNKVTVDYCPTLSGLRALRITVKQ